MKKQSKNEPGRKKSGPPERELHFTSVLERSDNKLWSAHVHVSRSGAQQFVAGGSRRVVCTINDSAEFQRALLPYGDGAFVITVNKSLRERLGLSFGAKVRVSLREDKSAYGLPMPEELEELLRQDKEGDKLFHSLTMGRQRTLLYIIGSVKDPEKRALRAAVIIRHLKANDGKINYKQLYASLKQR